MKHGEGRLPLRRMASVARGGDRPALGRPGSWWRSVERAGLMLRGRLVDICLCAIRIPPMMQAGAALPLAPRTVPAYATTAHF